MTNNRNHPPPLSLFLRALKVERIEGSSASRSPICYYFRYLQGQDLRCALGLCRKKALTLVPFVTLFSFVFNPSGYLLLERNLCAILYVVIG